MATNKHARSLSRQNTTEVVRNHWWNRIVLSEAVNVTHALKTLRKFNSI